MAFFRKRRKQARRVSGKEPIPARSVKKRRVFPADVKLLAVDALEAGLSPVEVSEIVGAGASTLVKWRKLYLEGGEGALARQASNPGTRGICGVGEVGVSASIFN